MPHNPKLIRDNIPEIIASSGKSCTTEVLSDSDYITKLDEKLGEELSEFREAHSIEELADLLEVAYAMSEALGCDRKALEKVRLKKRDKNGGFEKHLLLTGVYDNGEEK